MRRAFRTGSLVESVLRSRPAQWQHNIEPARRRWISVSAAELQFGQPLHETHPHLLKAGELTPGVLAQEYADRRSQLARKLPNGSCAILAAAELKYRAGAAFYEFHQDTDFYYLTGFNEQEALAIIEKTGEDDEHIFHLYVRPKDETAEKWEGFRSGVQAAEDVFNADESGDVFHIQSILPDIIERSTAVYTDLPNTVQPKTNFGRYISGLKKTGMLGFPKLVVDADNTSVRPLRRMLNDIRIIKSPAEITNMRKAGQASGRAFTDAMRHSFTSEKDLWAYMEYKFKRHGCDASAYVPVVGGGQNALSIHYIRNDALLDRKDLVLVDAGGEYGNYITDITRTWPVSGKFSDAQSDMYQMILAVQRSCVSLCRESSGLTLDKLHKVAENGLRDGLKSLGFDLRSNAFELLFPHHLGHYVGLDIHDCPGYSRNKTLSTGMCITIEPGIYVPNDERWPKQFRGMGIRIEDSIAVQEDHPLVLTTEAVKEVVDIEALRD